VRSEVESTFGRGPRNAKPRRIFVPLGRTD
jgi:hypothetical protein